MAGTRLLSLCGVLAALLVLSSFATLELDAPAQPPQYSAAALLPQHTNAAMVQPKDTASSPLEPNTRSLPIANVSAPARPFSDVDVSRESGRLSSGCATPQPDAERAGLLQLLPAVSVGARPGCLEDTPICQALRYALSPVKIRAGQRRQLVVTAAAHAQLAQLATFTEATAALRLPTLVLAMDTASFGATRGTTAAGVLLLGSEPPLARKWTALREILAAGVAVYWADVDAVLAAAPWPLLYGDSDVEALSEGWDESMLRGHVMGADDPSMGWSRYCETMRAALLSPSIMYLQPTRPALALTEQMARRALGWESAEGVAWGSGVAEALGLSYELLTPASDGYPRVGAKLRILHEKCWLHERAALSYLGSDGRNLIGRPAALLPGRDATSMPSTEAECRQRSAFALYHRAAASLEPCWTGLGIKSLPQLWSLERTLIDPFMSHPVQWAQTKALVLQTKCKRATEAETAASRTAAAAGSSSSSSGGGSLSGATIANVAGATPRALNMLVPASDANWPINCDQQPLICDVVRKVHRDRAVMAAVCNRNILQMLGQFVETAQKAKVPNFLVVAIDQQTSDFLNKRGVANYVRPLRTRSGSTDNHATSGLKFQILSELLSVGVSVLLTDVDVVLTQDPFPALYRDSDVEGMSDGWDEDSGYGFIYEVPLLLATPGGGAAAAANAPIRSVRMAARNSGLFFLSATHEAKRLMEILAKRMASEDVWDQSAYNQEVFRPSYAHYVSPGVSHRAMNFLCFLNTKVLFKYMRHDAELGNALRHLPVTVHINYHPEKEMRMVSVSQFYLENQPKALDKWNGGEGLRMHGCSGKVGVQTNEMPTLTPGELISHVLAGNIVKADADWSWPMVGQGPVRFESSGQLSSPLGEGSWGTVPSQWRKDSLHVKLVGHTYLLMFLSEKWAFVAVRCDDEQVSYGRLMQSAVAPFQVPRTRLVF